MLTSKSFNNLSSQEPLDHEDSQEVLGSIYGASCGATSWCDILNSKSISAASSGHPTSDVVPNHLIIYSVNSSTDSIPRISCLAKIIPVEILPKAPFASGTKAKNTHPHDQTSSSCSEFSKNSVNHILLVTSDPQRLSAPSIYIQVNLPLKQFLFPHSAPTSTSKVLIHPSLSSASLFLERITT